MKYFLSNMYDGCWYYRCYLPMLYNGFSGDKESFGSYKDRATDARMVTKADTIIFQRPDDEKKLEAAIMLKNAGKKIVFENDDTYKDLNQSRVEGLEKRVKTLDRFIKLADLVTTTTEFLADEYRKINPKVIVLKNCINPSDWPIPKRNSGEKIRIGIFGSATMNGDCDGIKNLLKELSDRKEIQLVAFGISPTFDPKYNELYKEELEFWSKLKIEYHAAVPMKEYFKALNDLELDIALVPRKDNYFNRCKSNLKFLEASMLEIPIVAQRFSDGNSPYEEIIDGETGVRALDEEEFRKYTELLIINKDFRRALGKSAKEYVLKKYDVRDHYKLWSDAFKTI